MKHNIKSGTGFLGPVFDTFNTTLITESTEQLLN